MLKLGEYQKLTVIKRVEFGVYLAETEDTERRVLLPAKQVPENTKIGDELEVFLYKDSKDRLIATTNQPKITLGGLAVLRVAEIGKVGAFLDWGLERDLFLPYKEMTMKVQPGDEILVTLYIDKSSRLCASMKKLYDLLSKESPYKAGDVVEGRVYEFSDNFGTFLAVDDKYSAMLPKYEDASKLCIGDVIEVKDKSKQLEVVVVASQLAERDVPDYIEVDHSKMTARVTRIPTLSEVPYAVQMEPNLVIEFYSR